MATTMLSSFETFPGADYLWQWLETQWPRDNSMELHQSTSCHHAIKFVTSRVDFVMSGCQVCPAMGAPSKAVITWHSRLRFKAWSSQERLGGNGR